MSAREEAPSAAKPVPPDLNGRARAASPAREVTIRSNPTRGATSLVDSQRNPVASSKRGHGGRLTTCPHPKRRRGSECCPAKDGGLDVPDHGREEETWVKP